MAPGEGGLAARRCARLRKGAPPLDAPAVDRLLAEVPGWDAPGRRRLEREFRFPDFRAALDFAVRVGAIAEAEDHHPEMTVAWGRAKVVLWTHVAGGLTENDFIVAAKVDAMRA